MNTSNVTIFPSLLPVALSLVVCIYTMVLLLFKTGIMRRKENEAHHSQPTELNKGSATCLAYFSYTCKGNSAAPLSLETERSSLIYTNVKRRQMFVQFN